MTKNILTWTSFLLFLGSSCALPQYPGGGEVQEQQHPAVPEQTAALEQQGNVNVGELNTGSAFTPTQSEKCDLNNDCVPWQMCVDGYISTSGDYNLDLRTANTEYGGSDYKSCGIVGNVCCGIPLEILEEQNQQSGPVYVECSGGLYCVEKATCNLYTGYIGEQVQEYEGQQFVEINYCKGEGYVQGVCCQDDPNTYVPVPDPSIPGGETGPYANPQCDLGSDCVPYFQCDNGTINTDGTHLIDVRTKLPPATCQNPDNPDVPAVCCKIPGYQPPVTPVIEPLPVSTCPENLECVEAVQCGVDGSVNTDGEGIIGVRIHLNKKCYWTTGVEGVCCLPPQPPVNIITDCPYNSVCIDEYSCSGEIVDSYGNLVTYAAGGAWSQCPYANGGSAPGVCCVNPVKPPITVKPSIPVVDACLGSFVCLPNDLCIGKAVDSLGAHVSYTSGLTWTQCPLSGDYSTPGICCANPEITTYKPDGHLKAATECGISNVPALDTRIQSDYSKPNEAVFGEFPWQAIIFYSNFTFKCGASIINNNFLVTAAHCVDGLTPYDIRIRVGEWQVNSFDEPLPYEDLHVKQITMHPQFRAASVFNDVAILELDAPIGFKYHINSVCLPSAGVIVPEGTRCFTSGWGKDAFEGSYQHILKKIDVPVVERNRCQDLLRKTRLGKYFILDKSFMCAGGEENKDACRGDGGGPLTCIDPYTGRHILTGITAWGINCGNKDVPGVYADVQLFYDWILDIIDPSYYQQQQQKQQPDVTLEGETSGIGYGRK